MKSIRWQVFAILLTVVMLLSLVPASWTPKAHADAEPLLAFPGAMGFGAYATGGRGGEVRIVTNLNDSGPGSFRSAALGDTPKTIVFAVSGIIRLLSNVDVGKNTTIAGQTSPEGITFYNFDPEDPQQSDPNGRLELNDNTIIRHIRVRGSIFADSPIQALGHTHFVILDHVSLAWGGDDNLSLTSFGGEGTQYMTVQWSTIEEPLEGWHEHPDKRSHNYGMKLTGPDNGNISVYYNLLTHVKRRDPSMDFGKEGVIGDVRSNVYYNSSAAFKITHGDVDPEATEVGSYNYMNNYFKHGEDSGLMGYDADTVELETISKPISLYMSGNYDSDYSGHYPTTNDLLHYPLDPDVTLLNAPVAVPAPYPDTSAEDSYDYVTELAGAWPRDGTTERVVNDVINGTGSMVSISPETIPNATVRAYYSQWQGDLDDNDFPNAPAPLDTDQDGMPDAWEDTNGLDKYTDDHNGTILSTVGYTNLEVYINERADDLLPSAPPEPVVPTLPDPLPVPEQPGQPGSGGSGIVDELDVLDLANAADYAVLGNLQAGDVRYGDRTSTITSLPAGLVGADWIRTANDSKSYTGDTLSFEVTEDADVYVAHDDRVIPRPSWLTGWTNTGGQLADSTGVTFSLFKKTFAAHSTVTLGTNSGGIVNSAMYTVIVKPAGSSVYGIRLEGEDQTWTTTDGSSLFDKESASGGQYLRINADAAGDYGEFSSSILEAGAYTVKVGYVTSKKGGQFQLKIDGTPNGSPVDTYAETEAPAEVTLGTLTLGSSGTPTFRFEVTGKNGSATDYDARIDYVLLEQAVPSDIRFEGEDQTWTTTDGSSLFDKEGASGGKYLRINADAVGDYGEFSSSVLEAGAYTVKVGYVTSKKGGQFQLKVDGTPNGSPVDTYAETEAPAEVTLGTLTLGSSGTPTFRFEVTGKNGSATDYDARIDYVLLEPSIEE